MTLLPRHAELDSASRGFKNETLKRVQGDVEMVLRVTLPLSRHAELVSAS